MELGLGYFWSIGVNNVVERHFKNEREMIDALDRIADKRNIKIVDIVVRYEVVV
jgi:hypothetical protein